MADAMPYAHDKPAGKKTPAKDVQVSNPSMADVKAGVADGLSETKAVGGLDDAQRHVGHDYKPCPTSGSAGSRAGKSFSWK